MHYETLDESEWEHVSRVFGLLDEGKVEHARIELNALAARRPGHPDVRIVDAAVSLDEGEATRALEVLRGAERSADPAMFFHLRAVAHYELAHIEEARDDAERALVIHDELAEAHDLLSRIYEYLGKSDLAREHFEDHHPAEMILEMCR